jgi:hypothetical protein
MAEVDGNEEGTKKGQQIPLQAEIILKIYEIINCFFIIILLTLVKPLPEKIKY